MPLNIDNEGLEVTAKQTYGYLLSQSLKAAPYIDLALMGSSIDRTVLQLIKYVQNAKIDLSKSIAVFQLTSQDRKCFIDHNNKVVDLRSGNDDLSLIYYKYFYSPANEVADLHKNLLSLQAICKHHGIKDYYIRGWTTMNFDLLAVDQSRIYPQSFLELFDLHGSRKQYLLNCGHPNAAGHALVAKTLHTWITSDVSKTI